MYGFPSIPASAGNVTLGSDINADNLQRPPLVLAHLLTPIRLSVHRERDVRWARAHSSGCTTPAFCASTYTGTGGPGHASRDGHLLHRNLLPSQRSPAAAWMLVVPFSSKAPRTAVHELLLVHLRGSPILPYCVVSDRTRACPLGAQHTLRIPHYS